ncbi:MAG TPA: hypothetical protein VGR35_22185 [Tepidisphaeraceae bacterium]|nr:hypothetical protein [Tepidisphaeraceae bacterium]
MQRVKRFAPQTAYAAVLALLLSVSTLKASAPSTAPAARRADASTRHPAIQSAIAELTKEIESALRHGQDPPRAQSDYFYGQVQVPPAAVVAALRRPLAGDVRVAAYVKWQLLSALPKEMDDATTQELLAVYRAAPAPLPRPGIEKQQREELDRMIRGAKEPDEPALAEQFEQLVERAARDNRAVLAYRDELFARLPPTYDALAAGFEDAAARVNVGADAAGHVRKVCKAVPQWASSTVASPSPEQLKAMSRALAQLEKKKGQPYYNRLYWSASYGRMTFSKSRGSLASVSQLEEAQEFLDEKIRNPSIPLKMKEQQ